MDHRALLANKISESLILKVPDALKLYRLTYPECIAIQDLIFR